MFNRYKVYVVPFKIVNFVHFPFILTHSFFYSIMNPSIFWLQLWISYQKLIKAYLSQVAFSLGPRGGGNKQKLKPKSYMHK